MPRRTIWFIFLGTVLAFVCHERADRNPYGRFFAEVLDHVNRSYVEPVDDQKLFEGALDGMLSRLDDYSGYIARDKATQFRETIDQQFGGVGIEVGLDPETKQLTVITPVVGTPAYTAGIRAGDKIATVDGQSTQGFTLEDAIGLLRGKKGEPVTLGIMREGQVKPLDFPLVRAVIKMDSVLGDLRSADHAWDFMLADHPGIAYIRVVSFGEQTVSELTTALKSLSKRGMRGLILDLRNDPGGLLTAAKETCDLFLEPGQLIVSTRGRDVEPKNFYSSGGPYSKLPIAVLVNRASASASEIVAACLQDHGRAVVIGERTWGKGTVQNIIPVEGGRSMLRLTIASYWRPSNKNIHRLKSSQETDEWGVKPSDGYEVKMADKDLVNWLESRRKRDIVRHINPGEKLADPPAMDDAVLDKAVEYLDKKLGIKPENSATG